MVFLGGPRQCGKTTLAQSVLEKFPYRGGGRGLYLNWDDDEHRRRIQHREWAAEDELVVFDELHKFRRWKAWLKGLHDTTKHAHTYLVTGSARLDVYRRGGDSLMGRYHYWRLHPFTLSEPVPGISPKEGFRRLMEVGGFPEPFLDGDAREAQRWRKERFERVIRDDIRDLERIQEIRTLELFVDALREKVGGAIVLSNIALDLQVAQKTLNRWLDALERMYLLFVVRPLTARIPRAVQKPPKVYFFDNGDVRGDEGARFENLVATHLLKRLHYLEDSTGIRHGLSYIRDKEGREVDFAVLRDGRVTDLIEAKWADSALHRPLQYYAERLRPRRAIQLVANLKAPYDKGDLRIRGIDELARPLAED